MCGRSLERGLNEVAGGPVGACVAVLSRGVLMKSLGVQLVHV